MSKDLLIYSGIMLLGNFISAISQVLLKLSAKKKYKNAIYEYLNPHVIIAYSIFFAATFIGIIAYKVIPLSLGPILEATSYIYVTFFGVTIFKEKISAMKLASLAIIIFGIVVYSLWGV